MNRKILVLIIGLLMSALTVVYVSAAEVSQQYVSDDGTLSFSYPESYALGGDMETGIDLTADWGIALIYKASYDTLGLAEDSYNPAALLASLEAKAPERTFTDKTELVINGHDAIRANVSDVDTSSLIIILQLNPSDAVIVFASPSSTQYDTMETDVTALVATINADDGAASSVVSHVKPAVNTVAQAGADNCAAQFIIDGVAC